MRQRPVGTGPFKFVEFKPNKSIVGSGGEGCALDSIACIRMPTRNRRALSVLNLKERAASAGPLQAARVVG